MLDKLESNNGLTTTAIRQALAASLEGKNLRKALLIPPDITRAHSGGGLITQLYYELLTEAGVHVDILPALGTHAPMTQEEQLAFFGGIPEERFLVHNWRTGVHSLGEIPAAFVKEASTGITDKPIPVEIANALTQYDRLFSIGQVVPHEVVGMANFTKNIVVGCGGSGFISASHMVGAAYGAERIMGETDTPVRRLFDYAEEHFLGGLPLTYVLTVTVTEGDELRIIGLYIGEGPERRRAFEAAAALSRQRNITHLPRPIKTCVVWLDKKEFHSTWVGNKAVYRTRMALAEGARLLILAPGVKTFGEDADNDRLIRKYGYCGRENVLALCKTEKDLQSNLSAAAHLIHGSSDGRFQIAYAAPLLGREAVEVVGYQYADYDEMARRYNPNALKPGFNMVDGEEIYYVHNPALGLWKC